MTIPKPLRPWVWCGAWIVLIWSSLILLDKPGEAIRQEKRTNISSLSTFRAKPGSTIRILALGDSLLRESLPNSNDFNSMLGSEIEWVHLYNLPSNWVYFNSIMSEMHAFRPNLIIVQDSLLQKEGAYFPAGPRLGRAFANARQLIGSLIKYITKGAFAPTQVTKVKRHIELSEKLDQVRAGYLNNIPVAPEAFEFLAKLKSTADTIIVIHLPRSARLKDDHEEKQWLDYLARELGPMGIPLVMVGQPLPNDHYTFDYSHPNEKGRVIRIGQFKKLIAEYTP